jgi:hypothetical protein
MGEAGGNCETDAVCGSGLVCGTVAVIAQINQTIRTCGACSDTTPCMGAQICSPDFDLQAFSGQNNCVDPGTVANGTGCPFANGQGNGEACTSGHCTELKAQAGPQSIGLGVGLCGECASNADCMGGTCKDANAPITNFNPIEIGTPTGSMCQ